MLRQFTLRDLTWATFLVGIIAANAATCWHFKQVADGYRGHWLSQVDNTRAVIGLTTQLDKLEWRVAYDRANSGSDRYALEALRMRVEVLETALGIPTKPKGRQP